MDSFFSWDQDWHYLFLSLDNRISIIIRSMHLDFVFYFPILFWSVRHIVWFSTLSCVVEALHLHHTFPTKHFIYAPCLPEIIVMPHVSFTSFLQNIHVPCFPGIIINKMVMLMSFGIYVYFCLIEFHCWF